MWGKGQPGALKTERKMWYRSQILWTTMLAHHVPCISLIMNIFVVFHSNHLSVKFYFTNIFLSSSGWLLSFSKLKQTLKVICHNKFGFSQNCRGKYGRSLILKTTDIWLLLTGQPQRKKLALVRVFPVLVMLMLLPEAPLRPMEHCLPLSLSCPSYTQFLVLPITLEFQEGNLIFFNGLFEPKCISYILWRLP